MTRGASERSGLAEHGEETDQDSGATGSDIWARPAEPVDEQQLNGERKAGRLGDLLVERELITQSQLGEALLQQPASGKALGSLLVELGALDELALVRVLAEQLGVPLADLRKEALEETAIAILPESIARAHTAIPIRRTDTGLEVAMTDPLDQAVNTQPTLSVQVWDSAAAGYTGANPEPGGTIGDIRNIWVAFNVKTCIGGSSVGVTKYAQVVDTGTSGDGIGTASVTFPYTSSSETIWCVTASVVANASGDTPNLFYSAPPDISGIIAFYQDTGQFVTGGGTIPDAANGTKSNFGFVARYNKTGKPQGQMVYVFRGKYNGVDATFTIKSNALTGLSFTGSTYPISATLTGGANITVVDRSGNVLFSEGSWRFAATVTDTNANSGIGQDKFAITIWDKSNQLYRNVPATLLSGGNVVVHNPKA